MRSEPRVILSRWLAVAVVAVGLAEGVAAQAPLFLVDRDTRVESVDFRFLEGRSLDPERLAVGTALDGPGPFSGVRSTLSVLPGIGEPILEPFSPLVLQKDLVRLRRLYRSAGFPRAELDYEVVLDTARNVVDVTFVIDEGLPITLGDVSIIVEGGSTPESWLPSELARQWRTDGPPGPAERGIRLGRQEWAEVENRVGAWFRERGYPWAEAEIARADTSASVVAVEVEVRPGPRARVEGFDVEGNERLGAGAVVREFPLDAGDWFDERRVAEGESGGFGLPLVRRPLAGVPDGQARDSTVAVRVRIEEGRPHIVWGRLGYGSQGGVIGEAHWVDRSFLGASRTLTLSGLAESGWLSTDDTPIRSFGVSAALEQPYLGHRRVSGSVGPFLSFDEGPGETAVRYGLDVTSVYRAGLYETVTLRYELSRRDIDEALPLLPIREIAATGASRLAPAFLESKMGLRVSLGRFDDRRAPTSGHLVQPSVAVTTPGSEVEFVRLGLEARWIAEVAQGVSVLVDGSAGRLFPFGRSLPGEAADLSRAFVGLRDEVFTAGGTDDVRGWGRDLLGPKVPDVRSDSEGSFSADGYVPVGGLVRATTSVELLLPMPFAGSEHRTYLFLDSGRVWSPGRRFDPPDPELVEDRWFHGVGGGVQIATPLAPVRLGIGYKLNPSRTDVLTPSSVLEALLAGAPLDDLPADEGRRWRLHLALGMGL